MRYIISTQRRKRYIRVLPVADACSAVASCVFRDDFDDVRDKVLEADAIVFASPVYYFGLSAQIKAVIDRFYAINGDLLNLYKKTALILALEIP